MIRAVLRVFHKIFYRISHVSDTVTISEDSMKGHKKPCSCRNCHYHSSHNEGALLSLKDTSRFYNEILSFFETQWLHPNTIGVPKRILVKPYTKDPSLGLRFHGMTRACMIGSGSIRPCDNLECNLCNILKHGFSLKNAKPNCLFGRGVYSSVVSSKASQYAKNSFAGDSDEYVLIICGIDPGNSIERKIAGNPGGYDSVEGVTIDKGGQIQYPETVVYDPARIKPLGIVVYSRTP